MNGMQETWIVRVKGKEYGPVDLPTLLEWQEEGRLIATNPIRRGGEETWITAGQLEELFPKVTPVDLRIRRRTFVEVISESFRIFFKGFPQFFCLGLFVAIPSFLLQVSLAFINVSENVALGRSGKIASGVAVFALLCLLAAWPIFVGGLQFGAADLAEGRSVRSARAPVGGRLLQLSVLDNHPALCDSLSNCRRPFSHLTSHRTSCARVSSLHGGQVIRELSILAANQRA
jgi:hypothetical protein